MKRRRSGWRIGERCVLLELAAVLLLAAGSGCARRERETGAEDGQLTAVERTFERGPVAVTVSLDRSEMTIADKLNLNLRVVADEDVEIELPRFGDKLEQFGIVDYSTTEPRLDGQGKVTVERNYVLEPMLSGDYGIAPMTVRFRTPDQQPDKSHEISTEELTVRVKSLLPETAEELDVEDILPPEPIPAPPRRWTVPVAAAAVSAVVLCMAVWLVWRHWQRGRGTAAEEAVPAHEMAYTELQELIAADLVGKGRIKQFYLCLSGILRRYIENRFGLHAPEMTTEEFLGEMTEHGVFPPGQQQVLRRFMTHCDQVKFAEHQPSPEEIQTTFDTCKFFILETQEGQGSCQAA